MALIMQDRHSSPQLTDNGYAELHGQYQRLRDLHAEKHRLHDDIKRARASLEASPGQEDRQLIEAQLLTLETNDRGADAQVSQIRNAVNTLSRPFLRPLHILDLPNEILVTIFGVLNDWKPWYGYHSPYWDPFDQPGRRYIQNVRLTCRRFCSTSSQFLMSFVPVEICQTSLARLRGISSHPTISKGVTGIHVCLAMYDKRLAGDIVRFVRYHNNRLLNNANTIEGPFGEFMGFSGEDALRYAEKIRRITRAWTAVAEQDVNYCPTEEELGFQGLLKRGFEEFRIRYAEQQKLLDSGKFVAEIASAMAAMPAAKLLAIDDSGTGFPMCSRKDRRIPFKAQVLDDEKLCESLIEGQQMSYSFYDPPPFGSDAIPAIPHLLAALDVAGVRIASLRIGLLTNADVSRLKPHGSAPDIYPKVRSAMQELRAFDFINYGSAVALGRRKTKALREFFTLAINAQNLESLSVKMNLWDDESGLDPGTVRQVSVIKAQTAWANLSTVKLDTVYIGHLALGHLLNCVRSSDGFVGLHKVHLIDGSWIAVLDLLKERHSWACLSSPSGAECEAMSLEEYERVFGPYDGVGNRTQEQEAYPVATEAEKYIRGWRAGNPLILPAVLDPD